jgi:hypothetical protein
MAASDVFAICAVPVPDGAYLSDDETARTYRKLISDGFRWVRTDEGRAIFEREESGYVFGVSS